MSKEMKEEWLFLFERAVLNGTIFDQFPWNSYKDFINEPLPKGSGEPSAEQIQEKEDRMKAHYAESPLPWYSATTYKGLVQKFK
jgi:hypothetical protein